MADQAVRHILYSFRYLWISPELSLQQSQHYVTWVNYLINGDKKGDTHKAIWGSKKCLGTLE